jgi:hypothetical protein
MLSSMRRFGIFALAGLVACGSTFTSPSDSALASAVQGAWMNVSTIPGSSTRFTLAANGQALSGAGTFVGEAGPAGTISITGDVSDESVTLVFVYTATVPSALMFRQRFIGGLDASGRLLKGSLELEPFDASQMGVPVVYQRPPTL